MAARPCRLPAPAAAGGWTDPSAPATAAVCAGGRRLDREASEDPRRRRSGVTARGRALDRNGTGDRQRTHRIGGGSGGSRRRAARRRRAGAPSRFPAPAHPLPQARRRGDRAPRPAREAHGVRPASRARPGPLDRDRPIGLQHHRTAPVHRRRRAGPPPHASELRNRTRVRGQDTGCAEPPGTRIPHRRDHSGRRRGAVRCAASRGRGGREPVVPRRAPGRPQPRGAAALRGGGMSREPAHPGTFRAGDAPSSFAPRPVRRRGRRRSPGADARGGFRPATADAAFPWSGAAATPPVTAGSSARR